MVVFVKNPKLRFKVFKRMKFWDDKALKAFSKGDSKKGKQFEAKSDKLYADNYNNMFDVR